MESLPNKLVLVGDRCIKNQSLRNQVNKLSPLFDICFSDTGIEYAGCIDEGQYVIFVYDDFTDDVFERLSSKQGCIISPQIVHSATEMTPPILVPRRRPLYNHALKDQVICFTGFTDRSQVSQLAALVHYMDGTIRKEYTIPTSLTWWPITARERSTRRRSVLVVRL
ncbi:ECT2 [Bugula neritina]|uniref:ECT2 n=1 Tax=Bugula neritina TaxID=10212 RepID=A0A7J7KR53_BUGNE|nr:ECT2 [Bugula neritina]